MKTHRVASLLQELARVLKSGPDIELEAFGYQRSLQTRIPSDIAVNVSTLAALSKVDKKEWSTFIREYQIPIEIRPRDASRDIVGKLLRFLDTHPDALHSLKRRATAQVRASPELAKVLDFLLGTDAK